LKKKILLIIYKLNKVGTIENKSKRIPKGQSKMDNSEKLAI
jgi:hypothetical protein